MKLIEMRCPNCDAPLSVNAERDEAFCCHCSTMFLIEDAPRAEPLYRPDAVGEMASEKPRPEGLPADVPVEFETAKSEHPRTERFSGAITATPRAEAKTRSPKTATGSKVPGKAEAREKTAAPSGFSEGREAKRAIAIAIAVAVVLLVAVTALAGTCSTRASLSSASPAAHNASSNAAASSTSKTDVGSSSTASSSPSAAQASSGSSSSTPGGSPKAKNGFPCKLNSTATFSGVTIPTDKAWKDYSTAWDWRHYTFSYTTGSSTLEDVEVSISTFTGGDTEDAVAFMKDYADFAPINLDFGEYTVKGTDTRDGVTYTRIEGVNSSYQSAFSANPPSKYRTIRETHADKVVRCVCLVGYAEDGTGFAVAVALCGSADNDECLYSANKILDGVEFAPAECDTDSKDLWLYEVRH